MMTSASRWIKLFIALQFLFASIPTTGALLYSNTPSSITCCASISDFDWPFQIGDGFVLLSTGDVLINGINWYGQLLPTGIPHEDDFTIRFFTDDGGRPAVDPFASFAIGNSASRTDFGNDRYGYLAFIDPMRLSSGTQYYISIVANTAGTDDYWAWYAEDFPAGATRFDRVSDGGQWSGNGLRNYVFNLYGDLAPDLAVPEPTSVALLGLGLAALAFTNRRKP